MRLRLMELALGLLCFADRHVVHRHDILFAFHSSPLRVTSIRANKKHNFISGTFHCPKVCSSFAVCMCAYFRLPSEQNERYNRFDWADAYDARCRRMRPVRWRWQRRDPFDARRHRAGGCVSTLGGNLADPECTMNPVSKCFLQLVKVYISLNFIKRTRMAKHCKGVIDEIITDVLKMKEMVTKGELLFSVINVNDYKTKLKFDTVYGCRSGARVFVTECGPEGVHGGYPEQYDRRNIVHPDKSIELTQRVWKAWKSVASCPKSIASSSPRGPMKSSWIQSDFWQTFFLLRVLKKRFSSFSSFSMAEEKRQWQAQSKPKHRKTRTQTQAHQPKSYELQDYLFKHNVEES